MKTEICATETPQRLFVPIASFEFQNFEVPVQKATNCKRRPSGIAFRKLNSDAGAKCKSSPKLMGVVRKIFLPPPSVQGLGLASLHSGAANRSSEPPSSRQFHATAPNLFSTEPMAIQANCPASEMNQKRNFHDHRTDNDLVPDRLHPGPNRKPLLTERN